MQDSRPNGFNTSSIAGKIRVQVSRLDEESKKLINNESLKSPIFDSNQMLREDEHSNFTSTSHEIDHSHSTSDFNLESTSGLAFQDKVELRKSILTKRYSKAVGNINLNDLINVCTKKLEVDPSNLKALYIRANTLLKKGLFFDSLEDCKRLISIDPKYSGAYYIRGCAHEKINEIDRAIEDYSKVLELDPNHVNAVFARGACRNKKVHQV